MDLVHISIKVRHVRQNETKKEGVNKVYMLIKTYTFIAVPDVANLKQYSHIYINESDLIVEKIIATSNLKALEKFKESLNELFNYNQLSFPVKKYTLTGVTKQSKIMSRRDIRLKFWNSIKETAIKHNRLVLRERYSEISRIACSKINEYDIKQKLVSLDSEILRNVYDKARSYSFLKLRDIAFKNSPYTDWLVLDIGDAFHNHHTIHDSNRYQDNIITDLILYERWVYTLMELESHFNFDSYDRYSISEIMKN